MKKLFSLIAVGLLMAGCNSKTNNTTEAAAEEQAAVENADTVNIPPEERAANILEIHDLIKETGFYSIATVDGDQPHVRAFNSAEIINGRLYLMTGQKKDVFKQLEKNPKVEVFILKPTRTEWVRLTATLVNDTDIEVQKEFLRRNPQWNSSYQPGDGNMAMLYFKNVSARFFTFPGPVEQKQTKF